MKIHLIAIGGAVMHNLALALKMKGYEVTGSDDEIFEPSASRLERQGLLPAKNGWFAERIHPGLDAIILGMHARADNPELLKAKELGIPVYSFPEFVYSQSVNKLRIAVCGSHGKTTITSMVMHVLRTLEKDFDYLVGAQLEGFDTMVRLNDAPVIVIEGDEYFASPLDRQPKFLHYHAQINLISGIAWDHFNVFPTFEDYLGQFHLLINQLTNNDLLITNGEDPVLQALIPDQPSFRHEQYFTPVYDIKENNLSLEAEGTEYAFRIFGRHNMQNMAAAKFLCAELGVSQSDFYKAMTSFRGAARRLEVFKQSGDHLIFRDFAHAPSKVKATVDAVKEQYPQKKLLACLELHTYSSLNKSFIPQYKGSMMRADKRIVYINPHALELKNLPPLEDKEVKEFFGDDELHVVQDHTRLMEMIKSLNVVNTNILLMSSGNFNNLDFNELT